MPIALSRATLCAFAILALPAAYAQKTAADIPVETFFKRAQYAQMALSPDAEYLAALTPLKNRNNLVVIDLAKRTRVVITAFDTVDVANFYWVNSERLCLRVADGEDVSGRSNYRGTYCVDRDGKDLRDFTKLGVRNPSMGGYSSITPLALANDGTGDLFVAMPERTKDYLDAYRLNTRTGRFQILTFDSPGFVNRWVLDRNNVPRVAVSEPERKNKSSPRYRQVWYRDGADAKWEKIFESEMIGDAWTLGDTVSPIAFDYDNTTLYVSSNVGRDKSAIYKYDTKARKMGELVYEHPLMDITGGLVFSRPLKKLAGIQVDSDKPFVKWLDPELDRLQKSLDVTFQGTINQITLPSDSEKRALIFAYSDVDPGSYHLLDRTKPSLESIAKTRDWINPALMAERKFIVYKARDGMEIPAWVTIPRNTSGKNLPLIVNVHGGPWVRAYYATEWGRWPEAQFFASRGYVVLEPEPRGSTGWGRKHFTSSFKQWGQTMQDDINDGALHLVKEGLVDKSRMCIHGGSYGGYAAAMGVTRDPDFWKCGTPFVAVTDLFLFQKVTYSDIAQASDFFETDFKRMVGDSSEDKDMFTKYSPTKQAANVKVPVLLTMGGDDVRVPLVHGEAFRDALEAAGKKVEFVVYSGEGHGYNKDSNVVDFYTRLEKFFAKNLK